MILNLSKLSGTPARFSGEDPVEALDWEGSGTDIVRPAGALRWNFTARLFEAELLVEGEASADFAGICVRCGKDIAFTVREPFLFSTAVDAVSLTVDLTPEIRDAVLLALPLNPLCRPDCAGLCSRCGKSLETGSCDCAAPDESNPFGSITL